MNWKSYLSLTLAAVLFSTVCTWSSSAAADDLPVTDGLFLWLDAADPFDSGTTPVNGSFIDIWFDKSGEGNDVSANFGGLPTLLEDAINGQPAINFFGADGLDREMVNGLAPGDTPFTAFTVMRADVDNGNERLWELVSGKAEPGFAGPRSDIDAIGFWYGFQSDGHVKLGIHFQEEARSDTLDWDGDPHILEVQYKGNREWQHFHDGGGGEGGQDADDDGSGTYTRFDGFPDPEGARLSIGNHYQHPALNVDYVGDMGDIIMYDRVLTDEERTQVGLFLENKYGIDTAYGDVGPEPFQPGDANGDYSFDTQDIIELLAANKFETGAAATFAEGDFNGDGVFNTADVVLMLAGSLFETGPYFEPAAVSAESIPEPSSIVLLLGMLALAGCAWRPRRERF